MCCRQSLRSASALNNCHAAAAAGALQTGKSGGSLLQQALLLISAGSITGIMPVMFGVFFLMLRGWRSAVHDLSQVCSHHTYTYMYIYILYSKDVSRVPAESAHAAVATSRQPAGWV